MISSGLCSINSIAQDIDKAWEYFDNEQYELAALEFKILIDILEEENGKDLTYAEGSFCVGVSYHKANMIDDAIFYYTLSNEVYQTIPNGLNAEYYGISLKNLAHLYSSKGENEKALPLYLEALEHTKNNLGEGHPEYNSRLIDLAEFYESVGQFEEALPLYLEGLEKTKSTFGKDHIKYAIALNNLVIIYLFLEQYEKALPLSLEALEIAKKTIGADHPEYEIYLENLVIVHKALEQYDKILPYLIEALENTENSAGKNTPEYGRRLSELALLYIAMGRYVEALPLSLEEFELTANTVGKSHSEYGTSLNILALIYKSMGQYEKAMPLYIEALEIAKNMPDQNNAEYATRLNNLAALYLEMGQYEKALPLYNEALENIENSLGKDHSKYATYLNNLALLYQLMGQYEKALTLYSEAFEIIKDLYGSEHSFYGEILNNLATLYRAVGLHEDALALSLEAVEINKNTLGEDHPSYGSSIANLALDYAFLGQYEKALVLYLEALENTENSLGKEHTKYGTRLNNLALFYQEMGEYKKAQPLYMEALENTKQSLGTEHLTYANRLSNLAVLYQLMGEYEEALHLYIEVVDIIHFNIRQNFAFMSEKDKDAYLKTVAGDYEVFNSMALKCIQENPEISDHVFDNTLINKGILLKSSASMRAAVLNSGDSALINKFDLWTNLNSQIARLYSTEKSKRSQNPEELEEIATAVERELVSESQEFNDYKSMQNVDWREIQKALGKNEAAIEFITFDLYDKGWTDSTLYCALIVRPDRPQPELIPIFEEKQLEGYLSKSKITGDANLIKNLYGEKRGTGVLNTFSSVSYADSLYSLIWKPIDSLLHDIETLFYSPSGLLHTISFAAIPYNDSLLLSDRHKLVYLSSTANLLNPKTKEIDFNSANVALYGGLQYDITGDEMLAKAKQYDESEEDDIYAYNRNYSLYDSSRGGSWIWLQGTLEESENINQLLNAHNVSTTLYRGKAGVEESFKSFAGSDSPEIIHLATHGFFFPDPEKEKPEDFAFLSEETPVFQASDNPLIRSGIILAGANLAWSGEDIPADVEDGILTAYEVSGMDLFNTQLVVLSACETGLGDIKGSEGVYGLQRSFKMAGVDWLIMSLWQVPDKETSEFMILFYTKLLEKNNIREAFTMTQKEMREKYDPYYWAAFVLIE